MYVNPLRPRIIARLDIKNDFVIKGISFDGLRKIGDPREIIQQRYADGVDEIFLMDAVASLYDRNNLFDIVKDAAINAFIPLALGGGIRSVDDVYKALDSGADKVVINTSAVKDISIVEKVANRFGSQAMVASVEAKSVGDKQWQAYTDNGREPSGLDVLSWTNSLINAGAGEIIITSVDRDGSRKGFDLQLSNLIVNSSSIPVTISGGCGNLSHVRDLLSLCKPSGIAIASCFHYKIFNTSAISECLS